MVVSHHKPWRLHSWDLTRELEMLAELDANNYGSLRSHDYVARPPWL